MLITLFILIFGLQTPDTMSNQDIELDPVICSMRDVVCDGEDWRNTLTATEYRIMMCESKGDPLAQNPNSTAKGLFQFIDKTWENYCEGDVFSPEDNLRCFRELYPQHKSWWVCQ